MKEEALDEEKDSDSAMCMEAGIEKLRIKIGSLLGDIQLGTEKLTDVAERLSITSDQNVQAAKEMNTKLLFLLFKNQSNERSNSLWQVGLRAGQSLAT